MRRQASLRVNFIMNSLLTMSSFVFPLITFPYVSRILLPTGTGKVSFASSLIAYFTLFAQLGIPTYGIRTCARVRDNREELTRVTHELLFINLLMSLISYVLLGLSIAYVPQLREDRSLYLVISSTIFLTSIGMEWLYKALEQYVYITVRSIFFKFLALALLFMLVHEQDDYIVYGAISIFASSASNILNFINVHRYIDLRPVGGYNIRRHMKAVLIFFSMSCATTIYTNLDTVMLGFMTTDVEVGYYSAAVKIKGVLVGIVSSLGSVLLPRTSYYIENKMMDAFYQITYKAINFVLLISLPLMVYFMIYAEEGVLLLSGTAYAGAIVPMQIIMPTIVLIGLTGVMGIQILVPLGKEKIVLYSEIAGATTDLILNWVLIPRYGSAGAAIGTLVAEAVVWIFQFNALRNEVIGAYKQIRYRLITMALLGGCIASVWIKLINAGNFITLVLSSVIFFFIYGAVLLLGKEVLTCDIAHQITMKLKRKIIRN